MDLKTTISCRNLTLSSQGDWVILFEGFVAIEMALEIAVVEPANTFLIARILDILSARMDAG